MAGEPPHPGGQRAGSWRARLLAPVEAARRFFFGSDVFISYSRADAFDYAGRLAARLGERGVTVYLDQAGSEPGQDVPASVLRAALTARVLVLIASPEAMTSPAVRLEAESFPLARPVIPVSLGTAREDWPPWTRILTGLAVGVETEGAVRTGVPSENVVDRVVLAVGRWRQTRRIRLAAQSAVALLAVLLVAFTVVGRQLEHTSLALNAAGTKLAGLDEQLIATGQQLQQAEQSYAASRARLEELQRQITDREQQLETVSRKLDIAQQARKEQVAATSELWDFFETGIQDVYRQPSLDCEQGVLRLQPPLSLYFFSDRAKISEKAGALLNRLADCYLKLAEAPDLLLVGTLSARRRNAGTQGLAEEALGGGSEAYALALGQRQAEAVKHYLVGRGVPARSILTQSRGQRVTESFALSVMHNRVAISIDTRD